MPIATPGSLPPVAEKTVLVTGGSGFLGSWCVIELLRRGHRVRTTVRDLGREAEVRAAIAPEVDPGESLTFFAADLLRDEGWDQAVEGCDHVLHVASPFPPAQPKDPDELIVPARDGTLRVLRAALAGGVERIVITSSVAAVAGSGKPISREADRGRLDRPRQRRALALRAVEDGRRARRLGPGPR